MSTKSIEAFARHRDSRRTAPTLPPPPDVADHILAKASRRRKLAEQLLREACELELAAKRMRETQ